MSYAGKLFARVGSKGTLAFIRFTDLTSTKLSTGERYNFEIVWSDGGDRLPTGETGVVGVSDIVDMISDETLFEVNESTGRCPGASA